jgi:hypothetical protein
MLFRTRPYRISLGFSFGIWWANLYLGIGARLGLMGNRKRATGLKPGSSYLRRTIIRPIAKSQAGDYDFGAMPLAPTVH